MTSYWLIFFAIILFLIWIVAGGFVTQANVYLTGYNNKDSDLHSAYWQTFWAAFVTWFLVGLFIILIIAGVAGFGEIFAALSESAGTVSEYGELLAKSQSGYIITIVFLLTAICLVVLTGILSAVAANNIYKSSNYSSSNSTLHTAYVDCIVAASLSLGALGLLLIGGIIYYVITSKRQRELEDNFKKVQEQKIAQVTKTPPPPPPPSELKPVPVTTLYQQAAAVATSPTTTSLIASVQQRLAQIDWSKIDVSKLNINNPDPNTLAQIAYQLAYSNKASTPASEKVLVPTNTLVNIPKTGDAGDNSKTAIVANDYIKALQAKQ